MKKPVAKVSATKSATKPAVNPAVVKAKPAQTVASSSPKTAAKSTRVEMVAAVSTLPHRTPPPVQPVSIARNRRHVEHDLLLAALPHPILVLGDDERVIYANAAAETFFSMSQAVLKRGPLADVLAFGSPLVSLAEQVRRSGATVNEYAVEVSTPRGGAQRLVDVYAGPLPEQPALILLMLQQRSMAQMIERQMTHRAAARSVSGLAAVLAHEIKNPLSGIKGAAQLLEPALSTEDRALAQLICTETERIRALVDRMEVFGDERPLERTDVNVHAVLDHVKGISRNGFAREIKFVEDYDPSLPHIPANKDKLIQAFLNLVKNAAEAVHEASQNGHTAHATRDAGRIVLRTAFKPGVRLAVPGSAVRVSLPFMIEIEDNGAGIREDMKAHLFDPFVTTKRTGTGLGLALVAKIIRDHGGIIECDSNGTSGAPGAPRRTIFRVLLPIGV